MQLHQLSLHQPEAGLLCNEEAYLQMRPVLNDVQRLSSSNPIAYIAQL